MFVGGILLTTGLVGEKRWDSGKHDKWKRRYGIAENLVIFGVLIELITDGGVFFFSERLQSFDEITIAKLNNETLSRAVRFEQSAELFACLEKAPKGTVFVAYAAFNNEAKETHLAVLDLLNRAGSTPEHNLCGQTYLSVLADQECR